MSSVISLDDYRTQHRSAPPPPPTPPPPRRSIRSLAGLWVMLPAVMMLLAVATGYLLVVVAVLGGG